MWKWSCWWLWCSFCVPLKTVCLMILTLYMLIILFVSVYQLACLYVGFLQYSGDPALEETFWKTTNKLCPTHSSMLWQTVTLIVAITQTIMAFIGILVNIAYLLLPTIICHTALIIFEFVMATLQKITGKLTMLENRAFLGIAVIDGFFILALFFQFLRLRSVQIRKTNKQKSERESHLINHDPLQSTAATTTSEELETGKKSTSGNFLQQSYSNKKELQSFV